LKFKNQKSDFQIKVKFEYQKNGLNKYRNIGLPFFLLFLRINCYGQDSAYVKTYYHNLIIKPFIGSPSFELTFTPKQAADSAISSYRTNTYGILGIEASFRGFSISLSKKAGQLKDENVYGKSKYVSLYARLLLKRKWFFEGHYKDFKGYADWYTPHYDKLLPKDKPYFIRNDLDAEYIRVKGTYQPNVRKYSYPAAFFFTERQLKSAIAFLMMGNVNYVHLNADSSFFTPPVQNLYKRLKSIDNLSVYGIGFSPGTGFNLVWKKLFFAGYIFLGAELQYQKYYLPEFNTWESKLRVAPVEESKFSLGINGNRAFFALTVRNDINNLNLINFKSQTKYTLVTFDFGYRFNAPNFLNKIYNHFKRKD
jgi:hypothetical protein